ncbi:MAG: hypothetical protein R3Y13_01845 [bacterium]
MTKKVKKFLISNKVYLMLAFVLVSMIGVSIYVSFAFYTDMDSTNLITGQVGYFENPDMTIRFMVENRDDSGKGNDIYTAFWVAPSTDYLYNSTSSYCTDGASFVKAEDDTFSITTSGYTKCYFYYDAIDLDNSSNISIIVMKKSKGEEDYSYGSYYTTAGLKNSGLTFNESASYCSNGASVSYDEDNDTIDVSSSGKTTCYAYFD